MRSAVASPHPMQDPAPPTYSSERSASIMSARAFSLINFAGVSGTDLYISKAVRYHFMFWSFLRIILRAS